MAGKNTSSEQKRSTKNSLKVAAFEDQNKVLEASKNISEKIKSTPIRMGTVKRGNVLVLSINRAKSSPQPAKKHKMTVDGGSLRSSSHNWKGRLILPYTGF